MSCAGDAPSASRRRKPVVRAAMSVRLAIHAEDPEDLLLAGLEDAGASTGDPVAIRLFRCPRRRRGLEIGASRRRVATTGDGLWRRAPWPVNDALFDVAEPSPVTALSWWEAIPGRAPISPTGWRPAGCTRGSAPV